MSVDLDRVRELLDTTELMPINGSGPKGWVYFIVCQGAPRVKIGFTKGDVYKRLKNLQTGSSSELLMLVKHPGTPETERALHDRFASDRLHGEWFELTEEITAYMVQALWAMCELTLKLGGKLEPWMSAGLLHTTEKLDCISESLDELLGADEE